MAYIKYKESDGWDPSRLNVYDRYFQSKLKILQNAETQKQVKQFAKAKKFTSKINNTDFNIDEEFIAQAATKQLSATGVDKEISSLYTEVIKSCNDAGRDMGKIFNESSQALLEIRQGLVPDGTTFTVDSGVAFNLEHAVNEAARMKGNLSNTLGTVGEGVSSLAGVAIVNALMSEMQKQLGTTNNITATATYTNVGNVHHVNNYRSQTDNVLKIEFAVTPKNGGEVAHLSFSYNISDKANKKLANLSENKKSTGKLKIRNSTVKAQSGDLDNKGMEALYNTISYHYGVGGGGVQNYSSAIRYSGMHSNAGKSLRAYIGYKMLLDTLLGSKEHDDEINFTVYGSRIIPESSVVQKMLDKTKKGNVRYLAEIRYYQLLNGNVSAVKSESEAEKVIDKMPTGISESFDISLDK